MTDALVLKQIKFSIMIKKVKNQRRTAVEIFSSALCSLNCKYCYIPKTDSMRKLQKDVVKKLENKTFIQDLEKFYGKNLEYLGLWGAEPTLTLDLISKAVPNLMEKFPKLKNISFSTSLMTNPDIILSFIKVLKKIKKRLILDCQISLDGPAFITDVNRIKGAAQKVPENFFYIVKELNKINLRNLNIDFTFKSTLTLNNIRMLNAKPLKIKDYFDYFETIFQRYKRENKNKKVKLNPSSTPTLTVPGKYTSTDGKGLAVFFKNLRILAKKNKEKHYWRHVKNSLNTYTYRFDKIFNLQNELFTKPWMFTCSGGDSNFGLGIDNDAHICHRMFFLNKREYIDSIFSQKNIENWDVSLFNKGNIDLINDKYTTNVRNKKDWNRVLYILRNYHDFTRFRNSYIMATLKELALCGQADKRFLKDDNLCLMFAIFINSALSCPAENLLNTGAIYFTPVSIFRLFANGAFFEILKDHYENLSTRK